jgi:hypothetical protein
MGPRLREDDGVEMSRRPWVRQDHRTPLENHTDIHSRTPLRPVIVALARSQFLTASTAPP